jgi:Icc-related predicted phosphoesterase
MKVLCISDTHGVLPTPPNGEYDVFIHAGDIAPCTSLLGNIESGFIGFPASQDDIALKQLEWYESTFIPWINSINAKHKIIIPGNHDLATERYLYRFEQIISRHNIEMLLGSAVKLTTSNGEINVYGYPWIVPVGKWAWCATAETRQTLLDQMPDVNIDILLSHAPPYGCVDEARGGYHIGVPEMNRDFFASRNIGIVLCGHCHEQGGEMTHIDNTPVYNIAYTRDKWQTAGFTIVEKQEGKWIKREN